MRRGEPTGMRIRRPTVIGLLAVAVLLTPWRPVSAQENPISLDPQKGTLDGSPVDHLPPHIRLLDIRLPDGGTLMRPDWAPDGQRLVFLDAPIGDVWEHDLAAGTNRNLTGAFLPGGVLRAHHLPNGDLVLCAPAQRSAADPEGDRFRGELLVLPRPLGTQAPVALDERCWAGIAVSKHPASTRIAWNQSTIDFTDFPNVFVEALLGTSVVLSGRIVYNDTGTPRIAERTVVLDKHDVSLVTPAVEAQDFRSLDDGDADPDDELIFSAYFHNGGQAMGLDLDTGAITDYAPLSPFYEEAEGVDPAGRYVLVERDLTVTLFPGMLDIWRLALDGSGTFERVTTFDHYRGYGANNPVVSPDGHLVAFSLKVEGEEGEGDGILLLDLSAPGAPGASGRSGPADTPTTRSSPSPAQTPQPTVAVEAKTAGVSLPRTGAPTAFPVAAVLLALALLAARVAARTDRRDGVSYHVSRSVGALATDVQPGGWAPPAGRHLRGPGRRRPRQLPSLVCQRRSPRPGAARPVVVQQEDPEDPAAGDRPRRTAPRRLAPTRPTDPITHIWVILAAWPRMTSTS